MKNQIYGSGNYQDFMNDSSNHAKEGEGVPEMLQRKAKEQNLSLSEPVRFLPIGKADPEQDIWIFHKNAEKEIARKLLEGGL